MDTNSEVQQAQALLLEQARKRRARALSMHVDQKMSIKEVAFALGVSRQRADTMIKKAREEQA